MTYKRFGFTLVETMIAISVSSLVLLGAWQVFRINRELGHKAQAAIQRQELIRRPIERLKNDIRAAVRSELLAEDFIIQHPVTLEDGQFMPDAGYSLKFAIFTGYDTEGRPMIEKIMYSFDPETGSVLRGNWEGEWSRDNQSAIINPREISRVTNKKETSFGGYLYFTEFYTDQDKQLGLLGRKFIKISLRGVFAGQREENKEIVELNMVIGPRYINSRDREPFWNQNSYTVIPYSEFMK